MNAESKRSTNPCKKLHELPAVLTEWQQTAWYPDCDFYHRGMCGLAVGTDHNTACPFDGKQLPVREAAIEGHDDQPAEAPGTASRNTAAVQQESTALVEAIKRSIVVRTWGRIQSLEVEQTGGRIVIPGWASCYYLKQLALQGVRDVIGSARAIGIELNVRVPGSPATSGADAQ